MKRLATRPVFRQKTVVLFYLSSPLLWVETIAACIESTAPRRSCLSTLDISSRRIALFVRRQSLPRVHFSRHSCSYVLHLVVFARDFWIRGASRDFHPRRARSSRCLHERRRVHTRRAPPNPEIDPRATPDMPCIFKPRSSRAYLPSRPVPSLFPPRPLSPLAEARAEFSCLPFTSTTTIFIGPKLFPYVHT